MNVFFKMYVICVRVRDIYARRRAIHIYSCTLATPRMFVGFMYLDMRYTYSCAVATPRMFVGFKYVDMRYTYSCAVTALRVCVVFMYVDMRYTYSCAVTVTTPDLNGLFLLHNIRNLRVCTASIFEFLRLQARLGGHIAEKTIHA